jgi:hypothetical protein
VRLKVSCGVLEIEQLLCDLHFYSSARLGIQEIVYSIINCSNIMVFNHRSYLFSLALRLYRLFNSNSLILCLVHIRFVVRGKNC